MLRISSKINTSKGKGKVYLSVVSTLALLLVMTFSTNMNFMNVNAYDFDGYDYSSSANNKDIGKSEECVKVVRGCGGQGTVGDNKPIGPIDPIKCEECLADLSDAQKESLFTTLGVDNNVDICESIEGLTSDALLELLLNIDVELFTALEIMECFSAA